MSAYEGRCYCNNVRFTVSMEPTRLIDCNCSICTKKGILHMPVEDAELSVDAGEADLSLYQFVSDTARHCFASTVVSTYWDGPVRHPIAIPSMRAAWMIFTSTLRICRWSTSMASIIQLTKPSSYRPLHAT